MQSLPLTSGLALLLAGSLAGHAQELPPTPRYYLSAGLYASPFQQLGYHYGVTTFPVQVAGGYQWRPRWTTQLSVAYSGSSTDYAYDGQFLDPATGAPIGDYANAGHATDRRLSAALLARRTLTRQAAHRLQFDALGGFTYEHGSFHETGLYTSTNPQAPAYTPYDNRTQLNRLLVGLGASLRCRVTTRLEVLLDVLLNAPLDTQDRAGVRSATSLGLRYRFKEKN